MRRRVTELIEMINAACPKRQAAFLCFIPERGKEKKMKKRIFDIYLALPNPSGEKDTDEHMIKTKR